jgi:hypothetical protein
LGRFLETDPIAGGNANAYNYPNDPANGNDWTGDVGFGGAACECGVGDGFLSLSSANQNGTTFDGSGFGEDRSGNFFEDLFGITEQREVEAYEADYAREQLVDIDVAVGALETATPIRSGLKMNDAKDLDHHVMANGVLRGMVARYGKATIRFGGDGRRYLNIEVFGGYRNLEGVFHWMVDDAGNLVHAQFEGRNMV